MLAQSTTDGNLPLNLALMLASVAMLYFGAEWLVTGSAVIARSMRIRPIVIGLTVVAFATSAPELVVGIVSTLKGVQDVSVGNVIGANVANVGLIIGSSALVSPLVVGRSIWRKEVPIAIAVQIVLWVFCLGGVIQRWQGLVLVFILVAFVWYMIRTAREADPANLPDEVEGAIPPLGRSILKVAAGVGLLAGGGYLLVLSATEVAAAAGIQRVVIGATLVAFLTTVPELATSVIAARRGEGDIAVGNAIGSIFFNTAFVIGTAASLEPIAVTFQTTWVRIPIMIGLMLVLLPFMRSQFRVTRWEGAILLACYAGFVAYSLATGGAAAPAPAP